MPSTRYEWEQARQEWVWEHRQFPVLAVRTTEQLADDDDAAAALAAEVLRGLR